MHVIWKRPDGYLNAEPNDYRTVEVREDVKIWLHQQDKENFPFRISGGWQDENQTRRVNLFVNNLGASTSSWIALLEKDFGSSNYLSPAEYVKSLKGWVEEILNHLKGDQWEVHVMTVVFEELRVTLHSSCESFLQAS
ncbi:MAG: hypothetical protein OXT67_13135 [Zetaproteobacteria bacterium]|nr:hypothetical protein [Zetaproteobacteria bacterium]